MIKDQPNSRAELDRLVPGLRRFARALVARNADDPRLAADTLTRDTLTRAARAGGPSNLRIWLYATLTTLNRARARGASGPTKADSANGLGVTDALDALPLSQREALLLVVLEGFSYSEAGDALGLSRATVAALVARARVALEQRMDLARPSNARSTTRTAPYLRLVT